MQECTIKFILDVNYSLMTKFSKKLVSKCVYVLILKSTENELVDLFMGEGGWSLIQTWLQDAVQTSNWDLVQEILGLLLVTPVDVERLKLNILPKLIKSLSRREDLEGNHLLYYCWPEITVASIFFPFTINCFEYGKSYSECKIKCSHSYLDE